MEIERKFLVEKKVAERMIDIHAIVDTDRIQMISQFYTSFEPEIRYRRIHDVTKSETDTKFLRTVKNTISDLVREEIEEDITGEEYLYKEFSNKYQKNTISKTRLYTHIYTDKLHEISIDYYLSKLAGLYIIEVEFESVEEANRFISPTWFGKEVTNIKFFKNINLAKNHGMVSVVDTVKYLIYNGE